MEKLKPSDFEAELDTIVQMEMEENHIPGMVLVVVHDGKLFFRKGYGFSNIENREPVDPKKTLFRVGSLSKPVTALAVMQLIEAGKLDLKTPVNSKFNLFPEEQSPVTVQSLLTHTSGLDEVNTETSTLDPIDIPPLEEFLQKWRPSQVRKEGELFAYSNYGFALLGYLIAKVSGETFESYMNKNVFSPLGMKQSTFQQFPVPKSLATGYEWEGEGFQKTIFEYIKDGPAGSLISSGDDMTLLLQSLLNSGAPILGKQTFNEMQKRHFCVHPKIPGVAFGLFEELEHRWHLRALKHSGAVDGFGSYLYFTEQKQFGFFLAGNSIHTPQVAEEVKLFFLKYFFGPPTTTAEQYEKKMPEWSKLTGTYRPRQYSHSSLAKLRLLNNEVYVRRIADGSLELEKEDKKHWDPITPTLFRSADHEGVLTEYLYFELNGPNTIFFMHDVESYEKLNWYQTRLVHATLSLILLLSSLATVFWLLVTKRDKFDLRTCLPFLAMGTLNSICIIGIALALVVGKIDTLSFRLAWWEQFFLTLPWLSICFTIIGLAFLYHPRPDKKIRLLSLATSFTTLLYFSYWNIIHIIS